MYVGFMKKLRVIPNRGEGCVGDLIKVGKRTYLKAPNGKWGIVVDCSLVADIRRCYVDQHMTLRETAGAISDEYRLLPSSLVQQVCNQNGWMRSHYGRKEQSQTYLRKHKKPIKTLFTDYGLHLKDIAFITGVGVDTLSKFMRDYLGLSESTGRRVDRLRREQSRLQLSRLSGQQMKTWNSLLELDVDLLSFKEYKRAVRQLSDLVYRAYCLDNHRKRSLSTHIDHIVSIHDGYWKIKDGCRVRRDSVVPLQYMCHTNNLRLLSSEANLLKGDNSDMSIKALKSKVNGSYQQIQKLNRRRWLLTLAEQVGLHKAT
jgi:hypothetical protein